VEELKVLYDQGYKSVVIVDDNFTHDKERADQICDMLIEQGIRMRLYCEGRANNASYEMLRKMKRAGFDVIYFGAESASPAVLKYYNKKVTPKQVQDAVTNAKRAGLIVITSFIVGAPVETQEEMEETLGFISKVRPHGLQVNILDYLLGTPLWDDLEKRMDLSEEAWMTNHRVYEYDQIRSHQELDAMVQRDYDAYISSWKNVPGMLELLRLLSTNWTARQVIFRNIFNPQARKKVVDGWSQYVSSRGQADLRS